MNLRNVTAAILAIVIWAGPALLVAQPLHEWSDITYVQGKYSRLYFDYQQPGGGTTLGTFYCLNDWAVNQEDGCINGGIVCDSTKNDTCEANLYYFQSGATLYTITIYKNSAKIDPPGLLGFEGKFSWNPSVNSPIEHTIWEFSFSTPPIEMVQFTGHDPAVPSTIWTPQSSTFTTGPSDSGHFVDGIFANLVGPDEACNPTGRSFIPDASLPKDPGIPPLKIILHEGGGVTVEPQAEAKIPTLTEWGLIIFAVLLVGFMTWVVVKRRRRVTIGI